MGVTRLSQTIKRAHYAALAVLVLVIAGTVVWISGEHTRLARDSSVKLVESAINTIEERVRTITIDYSYWEEAYVAAAEGDTRWLYSNIGTGATETEVVGRIGIAHGTSGRNYGWRIGGDATPTDNVVPRPVAEALISQIAPRPVDSTTVESSYHRLGDQVWLFAIARIVPYEVGSVDWSQTEQIFQIHGIEIDGALLAEAGESVLISGLGLTDAATEGATWLKLADHRGVPVAAVSWELPSPGTQILGKIALPLALALGTVVLLGIYLSRIAERSAARLERALDAAQSADRVKSEFLANVTHELRTPIHGVVNLTEMLQETALDAEQRELVGHLMEAAATQKDMVERVLDYSHIESGRRVLSFDRFRPAVIAGEIAHATRLDCEAKGLAFHYEAGPEAEGQEVIGDRLAFKQIVSNLCANAVKYTDTGSVTLTLSTTRREGATDCVVSVTDTGRGIAPLDRERIFEQFVQLDSRMSGAASGAGLGLSISRSLADLMGGRITVESAPGRGSRFTLSVSLETARAENGTDELAA